LEEAADLLAQNRSDFEVWVTWPGIEPDKDYLKAVGWRDHTGIMDLYRQADICVVPSVWDEPFGLVAVEAMATGRPVCVSRVGGLQHIVQHEETGFVFDREDSATLAAQLARLLEGAELRRRMGDAGRRRAETEYDWKQVVCKHYPPLLKELRQ
jgi:glycosyltransferase involved in cell wall biosynthesis